MKTLLLALLFAFTSPALAAQEDRVQTFERAEWVETGLFGVPGDNWAWAPISLPHNWFRSPPFMDRVWYRVRFTLDSPPAQSHALYFSKLVLRDITVYVNQQPIWTLSEAYAASVTLTAVRISIPPGLLRAGENVIHLEASGNPRWFHGIARLQVGPTRLISQTVALRSLIQGQMVHIVAAGLGAIGFLALWLWLRSGRDPVLFWYGISGVTLLVATALWYLTMWRADFWNWRLGLIFTRFHGYLVPLFILHLRLAGRRHPWFEAALWLMLAVAFFSLSLQHRWHAEAWAAWGMAFAVLPLLFIVPLLASPSLRRMPAAVFLIVADVAASLLTMHDWASRFGWIEFDRPFLVYFAAPFVMLAGAVPIMERLMAGIAATRRMNVELERRVAAKAIEIESAHARLQQAQRAQALADERRRIMVDMHDGLGARLVSLLSIAQSGKARPEELSEGIATALDELRLTVDSVQPVEGDVGVVLGNVRHRMRSVFERAGIRFLWNVSALPRMDDLTPDRILAIQRIFLEVFSNALKHAGARSVAVSAARVPGAVQIVIADDGRGFEPGAGQTGNGLANLQLRARQAGGALVIDSGEGKGTRVTLSLPLGEAEPPDRPGRADKEAPYPIPGISPEPSQA